MENNVRLIDANALIKHYSCVEAQKSSIEKIRAEIIVQALENAPTITPKSFRPAGRNDRERLIELLARATMLCEKICSEYDDCYMCPAVKDTFCCKHGIVADRLLASGVTFAPDTNDGSKWVPVTEPPKGEEAHE